MRYVIYIIELCILSYYVYKIKTMKMSQINIAKESTLITMQWFMFTFVNLIIKMLESKFDISQSLFQTIIFIVLITRNLLACLIAWYYSIYLVNKNFQNQSNNKDGNLQKNLGTFAVDDFDVAMKS